jgi:tetratricopeptide (TPR) repeat protein
VATIAELYALAAQQHQAGNVVQAEQICRQILQAVPNHADAHHLLGILAYQAGRFDQAVTSVRQAVALQPHAAHYHFNLGLIYDALGRLEEARICFHDAVQLQPAFAEGWCNLANVLKRQQKLDEASACYRQALVFKRDYPDACNNLGSVLALQNKLEEAITWYREALRLNTQMQAAYFNWGTALAQQDKLDEAARCYEQALAIDPHYAAARANLGHVRHELGQLGEALACFDQVLRAEPQRAETHYNRALVLLLLGDWAKGWPEYEWRWQTKFFPRPEFHQPRWDGSPLAGRTLLVVAEQGLGDTLHFVRYVLLLRQAGERVILQCQPPLLPLLAGCMEKEHLIAQGEPVPAFDVYAPLLSLPALLGTTGPSSVPAAVPYLNADAELIEYWRRILGPHRGLRVGIAWQGAPTFRGDSRRSIPLAQFAPLARMPGVQLISLQKGPGTEQLSARTDQFPVLDLGSRLDEVSGAFMDTAAVMKNLDLVISSDTAVPHLAGALGLPVWMALSAVPDWRWLLRREDSPWYPTVRLFRQTRFGQWDDVFQHMAEQLTTWPL